MTPKRADGLLIGLTLAATIIAVAAQLLGARGTTFAISNLVILGSYAYVAVQIAPFFRVDAGTKAAAVIFFLLCGVGTHGELFVHTVLDEPMDWGSWHLALIHAIQAASVFRFIYGLRRSAIVDRSTLRDLTDSAEKNHPNGESVRKAREALGE